MSYTDPVLLGIGDPNAVMPTSGAALTPYAHPTAAPTSIGGLNSDQLNAQAVVIAALQSAGLDTPDLIAWARQQIVNGATQDQMMLELYDPTSTPGKVIAQKFPELQMRKQNGYTPITISQAAQTRDQIKSVLHTYLPQGMYDSPDELAQLIGNDRSPSELDSELKMYAADAYDWHTAMASGDQASTIGEMQRLYGIGPSSKEVLASYIDPTKADEVLRQQEAAARISATAGNTGFGTLQLTEAERLASLGLTQSQAQQGFTSLSHDAQLMQPLPGEEGSVTPVGRAQQLAAAFEGNASAQQQIEKVRRQRAAVFQGGGGFSSGKQGIEGIGTIPQG